MPSPSADQSEALSQSDRGGRILRVIDEAPPPEFAALEAAYAPKRRGRKPGSKNKPKVAATPSPGAAGSIASSQIVPNSMPHQEAWQDKRGEPAPVAAVPATPASATPAMQKLEPLAAMPHEAVRNERRAGWQRDQLKPGEGWKRRRLPRVCW